MVLRTNLQFPYSLKAERNHVSFAIFVCTMKMRIYFFVGTTAEIIKISPIIRELQNRGFQFTIITSGQNSIDFSEMNGYISDKTRFIRFNDKGKKSSILLFFFWFVKTVFFGLFKLRKEFINLKKEQTLFIVHGDTVSTLIGSLIAKTYQLTLVHIESGLRSFNFLEPFPEEICRVITSHLTDIHFAPNEWSLNNLKNIRGIKINTYQNTLSETYLYVSSHKKKSVYSSLLNNEKYFLLVIHRQENIMKKNSTRKLIALIIDLASKHDIKCVFVMHHLTKQFLKDEEITERIEREQKVIFIPRLPYFEFLQIFNKSKFVVTDGGSNQEEAFYAGIPCLLLRNCTERIEGLGANVVLSENKQDNIEKFFKEYRKFKKKPIILKKRPAKIIVDSLLNYAK